MLLNSKNPLIAIHRAYKDNVNALTIRTGEFFRNAVRETCPAVIIVHNHPFGDLESSSDDIAITEHISKAARYWI